MAQTDPVLLEIMKSLLTAVAEEMGGTLGRTGYSPNIKERRDYSSALFDGNGNMVAQAAHIPVHLGAMPLSVKAVLEKFGTLEDGDIVVLNDPYCGGSHLPDITMVSPVYFEENLLGYVASRAHHADVGGISPGSMPLARTIFQEGLIIPPVKLQRGAEIDASLLDLITRNSRTPEERLGDLSAQIAAQHIGIRRMKELARRYGVGVLRDYMVALQDYAERMVRDLIDRMPDGRYTFRDFMDDDGFGNVSLPIQVTVGVEKNELLVDFTGTSPGVTGGVNAVLSVTFSAVFYVIRCLLADDQVPTNAGIFRPVQIIAPEGSLVNARFPRAVAAGNVETSQRITDVVLGAFARALPELVPAASQGTMNNLTIGGEDPRGGRFAYYETIAGGMGASARADGLSGVHVHMTNTLNTPAEAMAYAYPLRVTRYELRRGSGGNGRHRGGDGIYREVELLADATVTILSERRRYAPYGLFGGQPGARGENRYFPVPDEALPAALASLPRKKGYVILPGKISFVARKGSRIGMATPGGGGYGPRKARPDKTT